MPVELMRLRAAIQIKGEFTSDNKQQSENPEISPLDKAATR